MRELWVVNNSSLVGDAELVKWCEGIQEQIDLDFAPIWNESATLVQKPAGTIPPDGTWTIELRDRSEEQGALGFHFDEATPYGIVGVQDCIDDYVQPSACLSHEVLELIHDPECSKCRQVGGDVVSDEVCDAPEGKPYESANGTWVENFVYPSWFTPGAPGPYDKRGLLKAPLDLGPGGYKCTAKIGQWAQMNAQLVRAAKKKHTTLSRRARRMKRWVA